VKSPGRHCVTCPGHFLEHAGVQLDAIPQRLLGDHDSLGSRSLRRAGFVVRAQGGLIAQPSLREKHGQQTEHDGKTDHHDCAGPHESFPVLRVKIFVRALLRPPMQRKAYRIREAFPASAAILNA
jgi:hypothetical protein